MANDENEEKDYAGQPDTPAFNISNGSTSQLETLVQAASEGVFTYSWICIYPMKIGNSCHTSDCQVLVF